MDGENDIYNSICFSVSLGENFQIDFRRVGNVFRKVLVGFDYGPVTMVFIFTEVKQVRKRKQKIVLKKEDRLIVVIEDLNSFRISSSKRRRTT